MEKEDGRVNNRSAALPKSGMRNNLCQESVIHPKRGGPKFLGEKKGGFIDIFQGFSLLFFLDFGHQLCTCFEFPPGRLTPFGKKGGPLPYSKMQFKFVLIRKLSASI